MEFLIRSSGFSWSDLVVLLLVAGIVFYDLRKHFLAKKQKKKKT